MKTQSLLQSQPHYNKVGVEDVIDPLQYHRHSERCLMSLGSAWSAETKNVPELPYCRSKWTARCARRWCQRYRSVAEDLPQSYWPMTPSNEPWIPWATGQELNTFPGARMWKKSEQVIMRDEWHLPGNSVVWLCACCTHDRPRILQCSWRFPRKVTVPCRCKIPRSVVVTSMLSIRKDISTMNYVWTCNGYFSHAVYNAIEKFDTSKSL